MRKIVCASIVGLAVCFSALSASAQVKDKTFKDWTVYTTNLQGSKTCYIASFPKSKTGNYTKRDDPYFLVTRISDGVYEVSTSSGYPYKVGSDVSVDIQGNKFSMFTKGELAWAKDSKEDKQIIDIIKKKGTMNVKGTSTKGTYSVDKYSLMGFTAAYNRMQSVCK